MSVRPSSDTGSSDGEQVRITFWGTRGSVPSPGPHTVRYGGNTSCVTIDAGPHRLILDAGTGIRRLGLSLAPAEQPLDATLLLTHFHWDHVQGLPFFEPLYDRLTRLRILSPRQDALAPDAVLAKLMQSAFFPIPRDAIAAALRFDVIDDAVVPDTGFDIAVLQARHPDHTVGYRIRHGGASVVFMPDDELVGGDYPMPGDWRRRLLEFADGASVLLHDATFTESEYRHRQGWGHSTHEQALRLAQEAGVQRLVLFHHAPDRSDDELDRIVAGLQRAAGSRLDVEAAAEGRQIVLGRCATGEDSLHAHPLP